MATEARSRGEIFESATDELWTPNVAEELASRFAPGRCAACSRGGDQILPPAAPAGPEENATRRKDRGNESSSSARIDDPTAWFRLGNVLAHADGMDVNDITGRIIGCAIEVHRVLGPGLQERSYEAAMGIELTHNGLRFLRQVSVPVSYRGEWIGDYTIDLIVEDVVILEIKSVERRDPLFEAQVIAYLKASGKHVGLLINFNSHLLSHGIRRLIV
jgi:GxxExxY protein